METYHKAKFANLGIADNFVQDNWSCSRKGVLRGLHYQLNRPQAKLCRVIEGEALDVVVDIRSGSRERLKWICVRLSADQRNQIYIPTGFAHGFLALTENTQFVYKCSDFYERDDEKGIIWNDPDLAIQWDISDPILSDKDSGYRRLADIPDKELP